MSILITILSFILIVSPLIIIHELGHYLVGKYLGAKPTKFSLGMGPVIYSVKKWDTEWRISLLPIGGYVMFDAAQFSFEKKEKIAAWKWIPIALAGPLSNFLYTIVVLFGVFFYIGQGVSVYKKNVDDKFGVMILGERAQSSFVKQIITGQNSQENIFLVGEGTVTPVKNGDLVAKGIRLQEYKKRDGIIKQLKFATTASTGVFNFVFLGTVKGLGEIVKTKEGYKAMSGPVGIASQAKQASQKGILSILFFSAMISFALGFMNLIPLFILDGGRAVLAAVEAITRIEPSVKFLNIYGRLSFLVLVGLIIASTYSDITKFL